jgi:hypothetical protein
VIGGGASIVQSEDGGCLEDPAGTGFLTVLNPTYFNLSHPVFTSPSGMNQKTL